MNDVMAVFAVVGSDVRCPIAFTGHVPDGATVPAPSMLRDCSSNASLRLRSAGNAHGLPMLTPVGPRLRNGHGRSEELAMLAAVRGRTTAVRRAGVMPTRTRVRGAT
jgi:hypothetical protein